MITSEITSPVEKSPKKRNRRYRKKKMSKGSETDHVLEFKPMPKSIVKYTTNPVVKPVEEDSDEDSYSTVLKYYTFEQNKLYEVIKDQKNLSYINYATIDCRIKKLYKQINALEYDKFHSSLLDTIYEFRNAEHIEADPRFIENIIEQLSRALIDVSFQKYSVAHDRIRDIHYSIINVLMDLKFIV